MSLPLFFMPRFAFFLKLCYNIQPNEGIIWLKKRISNKDIIYRLTKRKAIDINRVVNL